MRVAREMRVAQELLAALEMLTAQEKRRAGWKMLSCRPCQTLALFYRFRDFYRFRECVPDKP